MTLILTLGLMLGLFLILHEVIKSSLFRNNSDARKRLQDILSQSREYGDNLEADVKSARKQRKSPTKSAFQNLHARLTGRLRGSDRLRSGEGNEAISWLTYQLQIAGLADRYDPYEAIALTLLVWGFGIGISVFLIISKSLPMLLPLVMMVFFVAYPLLKLRQMQSARKDAINAEMPFFIQELSMALSTGALSIDDAIGRVARNAADAPRRSILAEEFEQAHNEYRLGGVDRATALRGVVHRTGVLAVETLVDTILTGLETGHDGLVDVLNEYGDQAREMWRLEIRNFIAKKEPLITLSLVVTMFGGFVLYGAPLILRMMSELGNLN